MNRDRIRILVAEDDPAWGVALVGMYQRLLGEGCEVIRVGGGQTPIDDAKVALRTGFDLLSLDINLGEDVKPDHEGRKPGANGLDLLPIAKHEKVAGVVVITAARRDPVLHYVIPDGDKRKWVRQRLSILIDAWFPGRNIIIDKDLDAENAEENVEAIQQTTLTAAELRRLGRRDGAEGPAFALQVRGEFDASGDVRQATATVTRRGGHPVKFSGDNAAALLFQLARYHKLFPGDCLPRDEVLRSIRMKSRTRGSHADPTQMRVDSVRRQLAKEHLDGGIIETRCREGGFRLRQDVEVSFTGHAPRVIQPPYVLEQGTSESPTGEGNWRIRKKHGAVSRELYGLDASLVQLLKINRELGDDIAASHAEVLQALSMQTGAIEAAREAVALFKRRLRNHHLAIRPDSVIVEQDGHWLLDDDTELLSTSEYSIGLNVQYDEVPDSSDVGVAGRRLHRGERRTPRQRKRRHDDGE